MTYYLTILDNEKTGDKRIVRNKKFDSRDSAIAFYEENYFGVYMVGGVVRYCYIIRNYK